MLYIVSVSLEQHANICSLKQLVSAVHIINANSAPADLALPLVSSIERSKHTVGLPSPRERASANFLSEALGSSAVSGRKPALI